MPYCWLLIFSFGFTGIACAQQQIFNTYTVNDGLVANSVRRIFQDNKGFLWIATWEGLSKYDGHKFTNYSTANGLSHDLVNDLYETADNKLYVACNNGSVDIIEENERPKPIINNMVINRFRTVSNRQLFITTDDNGLWQLKNEKFSKPQQAFPKSDYYDVAALNDSLFVTASPDSFHILNNRFEAFSSKRSGAFSAECVFADSKKRVWIGTYAGLMLLAPVQTKNGPVQFANLPQNFDNVVLKTAWIRDIFEDADRNVWIATSQGLIKVNNNGLLELFNEKTGLPSDHVSCVFQDREHNIWIGTNVGLVKLVTKTTIRIYNKENGLPSNNVRFVVPLGKSNVLVTTDKSIQVYNKNTRQFFLSIPQQDIIFGRIQNTRSILLTKPTEFIHFDTASFKLRKGIPFVAPRGIGCAATDRFGNIFTGSYDGLYVQTLKHLPSNYLPGVRINNLLIDRNGCLWIGSFNDGLYRVLYSDTSNKITILGQQHFLPGKQIRSLYEDSSGNIWAGTRYHGVYLISNGKENVNVVKNFNQVSGLTSNWIQTIAEDANGCIWLGFYLGLDKLIPYDRTYSVFNFSRVNNYFANINHLAVDQDNSLWLATTQGLVNIEDGELEKMAPPPVYITSVFLYDSLIKFNSADVDNELQLAHKQNQLQFEFTAPGFINEKKLLYSYRLVESNNARWSTPANDHTVSYASLQPGDYRFEVRTLSWNGIWGDTTSFAFTIRPPFWKNGWFIACIGLITTGLIYWIVKRRINEIRKASDLKQKMAETEMMALRAQMNPHFIFNCLNSIDNLIQSGEKEKATTYLAKFAKLLRAILENSKSNTIPCWKDLETLKLYLELEEFRCDRKFSYQLSIPPEILHGDYKVPPMIIQPYVENAILHGLLNKDTDSRKLDIRVTVEKSYINYSVEDNGVGRKKAAEYKELNKPIYQSMGLDITRERINLFNQRTNGSVIITDMYDENKEATGTRVEVHLLNQP
jgi:ligand-binding sensor domain-containing protein